jgi:S-adenosylmethionine:tRNA ribosyltransferase-isomerase
VRVLDFDYELPPERIAQEPLAERDASRLLVVDRETGRLAHRTFRDLPDLLRRGDRLVVNDARVTPARLLGTRSDTGGAVELFLLHPRSEPGDPPRYEAMVRPARRLGEGTEILAGESRVPVRIVERLDARRRLVEFESGLDVDAFLEREGHMPLPPYIHRPDTPSDRERYQTVYAARPGSVAAPTAGLHFTPSLLARLEGSGIERSTVSLEVGPGTFAPVEVEEVEDHVVERERFRVDETAAREIAATRSEGGRIVAVGTTAVRVLETAAQAGGRDGTAPVAASEGWTELFIHPPHAFRAVDALVTNFHLPRSSLLMLVCALGGRDLILRAYREAVREGYRFYSYGDAMLVV